MKVTLNRIQHLWPSVICILAFVCVLCLETAKADLILYDNDQIILNFKCQNICNELSDGQAEKFFKLYFRQASIHNNSKINAYTPIIKHSYQMKIKQQMFELTYFDLSESITEKISKQLCADYNCQLLVKEVNSTTNSSLTLIKNQQVFYFNQTMPQSFVQKIIQFGDYDQYFLGSEIKLVHAKKRIFQDETQSAFGTALVKNGTRIYLFADQLKTQHLDLLKELTGADCAFFQNINQWTYCRNETIAVIPSSLSFKITTSHGTFRVQKSSVWTTSEITKLMQNLQALIVAVDASEFKPENNSLTIDYRHNEQSQLQFTGQMPQAMRDQIHLFMTDNYDCDHYHIYRHQKKETILVLQNKMPKNQELLNMLDSGLQKKSIELSYQFINRTQEITAPTTMAYLKREKLSSLSTVALRADLFPTRTAWGGAVGLEMYKLNNQSVENSNILDIGSQNLQYFAQLSHRFYPKMNMSKFMLISSLGVEQRHFTVDSNNSIGDLSYMTQYLALDLKLVQDQFSLHFSTRGGFLGSASQSFQNVQDFTSATGQFLDFSVKVVKEINLKFDLSLLAGIRRDKLTLNNESVNVSEMNLAVGLTYHWGER